MSEACGFESVGPRLRRVAAEWGFSDGTIQTALLLQHEDSSGSRPVEAWQAAFLELCLQVDGGNADKWEDNDDKDISNGDAAPDYVGDFDSDEDEIHGACSDSMAASDLDDLDLDGDDGSEGIDSDSSGGSLPHSCKRDGKPSTTPGTAPPAPHPSRDLRQFLGLPAAGQAGLTCTEAGSGPAALPLRAVPGGQVWQQPATAAECRQVQGALPATALHMVNQRVFGNASFREAQLEVVQAAVSGRHVFVLMPTGGGKSLCYQLPAVITLGVTVVVCPLLSLMQDQVMALCTGRPGGCGVPATYLSSQQSKGEALGVLRELNKAQPTCKLLYVTPEQLVKSSALKDILARLHARGRLARIVIDEAHCVSMWGHDFRPDYKQLGTVMKTSFSTVPITAVTATATSAVAADILDTLGIQQTARCFKVSFFRPNLRFAVLDKQYGVDDRGRPQPLASLVDYIQDQNDLAAAPALDAHGQQPPLRQQQQQAGRVLGRQGPHQQQRGGRGAAGLGHRGGAGGRAGGGGPMGGGPPLPSGIVYCLSRDESEQVCRSLCEAGVRSGFYHAGMTPKQRMQVQNDWRSGAIQVVVATIAFGMGIDKPDVRFVVHYTLSKSLEGYFQEAGRAGRDGLPSECVIFFAKRDNPRIMHMLRRGSKSGYQSGLKLLEAMRSYCEELQRCRHDILLQYFDDGSRLNSLGGAQGRTPGAAPSCGGQCDNCRERARPGSGGRVEARAAAARAERKGNKRLRTHDDDDNEYIQSSDGDERPKAQQRSRVPKRQGSSTVAALGGFTKASDLPVSERERPKAGKKQSKAAAGGKSKRTDSNTLAAAFARSGAGPGARTATDTDGGKVSSYFTAARPLTSAQSGADAVLNSARVSGGSAGAAPGTSTGTSGRAAMLSKASEDQRKAAARQASAMRKAVADLTAAAGLHDSQ